MAITYERLPNFCYYCGVLGHLVKDCRDCAEVDDSTGEILEEKLMYGDWLRANMNMTQPKYVNGSIGRDNQSSPTTTLSMEKVVPSPGAAIRPGAAIDGEGNSGISDVERMESVSEQIVQIPRVVTQDLGIGGRDRVRKGKAIMVDKEDSVGVISPINSKDLEKIADSSLTNAIVPYLAANSTVSDMVVDDPNLIAPTHPAIHPPISILPTIPIPTHQDNPSQPFLLTILPNLAQYQFPAHSSEAHTKTKHMFLAQLTNHRNPAESNNPLNTRNPIISIRPKQPSPSSPAKYQKRRGRPPGSKNSAPKIQPTGTTKKRQSEDKENLQPVESLSKKQKQALPTTYLAREAEVAMQLRLAQ